MNRTMLSLCTLNLLFFVCHKAIFRLSHPFLAGLTNRNGYKYNSPPPLLKLLSFLRPSFPHINLLLLKTSINTIRHFQPSDPNTKTSKQHEISRAGRYSSSPKTNLHHHGKSLRLRPQNSDGGSVPWMLEMPKSGPGSLRAKGRRNPYGSQAPNLPKLRTQ